MSKLIISSTAAAAALACAVPAHAGTAPYFTPITGATVLPANDPTESTGPWTLPAGFTQQKLTSMKEIEADAGQSAIRVPNLGNNASMWDMVAFSGDSRYVFIPHETQYGAGVSRYDRTTDKTVRLFGGNNLGQTGDWSADYGAFDPAVLTPTGTLLVAEEWSGQGRIYEVKNPTRAVAGPDDFVAGVDFNQLTRIPSVSHEGIKFDKAGSMYFIDEDNSGSIYKFVPKTPGDYTVGQTFVMDVDAYAGAANATKPTPAATTADRTGSAKWVAITDADGNALTVANPFDFTSRGGRAAADEVGGTPYGRPEDLEISQLANGNEVIYFAATSENAVYAIDLANGGDPTVILSAKAGTTEYNKGFAPTTGVMNSPDNLAVDAWGNIYVIEDNPNGAAPGALGGDTWFMRDIDGDGVAESLDHFLGIGVQGAEGTGMIFDPNNPSQFIIAVQHPSSMTLPGGEGDSLWLVTTHVPDAGRSGLLLGLGLLGLLAVRRTQA